MTKKRKTQLTIIIILMVLLMGIVLYVVGKSIYDYIDQTNKREETVEKFNEIYEKEGIKIILFASPTCVWCKKFVPTLNEIADNNNFKYEYLNAGSLFKNYIKEIYDKLGIEYGGIPNLIILNNKEVIGSQVGAQDEKTTIEFLNKTGIIKGDVENEESISTSS